jgi:hypothetical protein
MIMNTRTAGLIIGIVFVLVGILGFIPNPLVSPDGLFVVNTAHNLVHLISGGVILAGVYSFGSALALKIIGVVSMPSSRSSVSSWAGRRSSVSP